MKKNFIKRLLIATLMVSSLATYAQEEDKESVIESNDSKKNAVALYLGVPGIGVGYARKFSDHIALRGKLSVFSFDVNRDGMELGGRKVNVEGNFTHNTLDVLMDYNPFKKSSFKLVFGVSYLMKTKFDAVIKPASNEFKYGDISLGADLVGDIKTGADWSGIAPYLGLGFGRAVPKKNFGFGIDVGGYFAGKPDVTFQASGLLSPTEAAEKQDFTDWMQKYAFLPNFMLHFNYKF